MQLVLAISGGVDSMVMLDWCVRHQPNAQITVAHFDHGIRENSAEDATFVRQKAAQYDVEFALGKAELGPSASEATARAARYQFLRQVASQYPAAEIWTAHHLDDLVETVAINFVRGTGWRGLAVLDHPYIRRPFLEAEPWDKAKIWRYASTHDLSYREDPTNQDDAYLRNFLRHQINNQIDKLQLFQLWRTQKALKSQVDDIISEIIPESSWQREWFQSLAPEIAIELLRAGTMRAGISATRPQLEEFRRAILNYAPGKYFNLPDDHLIKLNKTNFTL